MFEKAKERIINRLGGEIKKPEHHYHSETGNISVNGKDVYQVVSTEGRGVLEGSLISPEGFQKGIRNILQEQLYVQARPQSAMPMVIDLNWVAKVNMLKVGARYPDDFYDYSTYWELYTYYPLIAGAVDLKQALIWQQGYDLQAPNNDLKAIDLVKQFIEEIKLETDFRDQTLFAVLFGNMYWHKEPNNVLRPLNPLWMGITENKDDRSIKEYIYSPPNAPDQSFPPEEILHLKFHHNPWTHFGTSAIRRVAATALMIVGMEIDLPTIVKRRADPPLAVQIGDLENHSVSDEEFRKHKDAVLNRAAGEDIFHDGVFQFDEIYKSGGVGTRQTVEPLLAHFLTNLIAGLSVPEIALGKGGTTTMATAEYQERMLEAEVRSYQRQIKKFLEDDIFPMISPVKVRINWRPLKEEDKQLQANVYNSLIEHGIVSPSWVRSRLGYPPESGEGTVMASTLTPANETPVLPSPPPTPSAIQTEYQKLLKNLNDEAERKKQLREKREKAKKE